MRGVGCPKSGAQVMPPVTDRPVAIYDRPMTSVDDVREFALSLPEVTEQPHFDMSSFRVRGKIIATVPDDPPGDEHLHVFVDEHEARAADAEHPAFTVLWWGKRVAGVRVRLASAPPERVRELLVDAWRRKASRRLVREFDATR